ncbi:MAG TPA: hypothetical protein VFY93_13715 [Planctomycetota bacterium]|nr:hypothetical protein [Planctomycetota bacterium]
MSPVDARSPGPSFLAFLAAPGFVAWSCWAYVLLVPEQTGCIGMAVGGAVTVGFVGFVAAIPAFYVRAPKVLRWSVGLLDLAAFAASLLFLCGTILAFALW